MTIVAIMSLMAIIKVSFIAMKYCFIIIMDIIEVSFIATPYYFAIVDNFNYKEVLILNKQTKFMEFKIAMDIIKVTTDIIIKAIMDTIVMVTMDIAIMVIMVTMDIAIMVIMATMDTTKAIRIIIITIEQDIVRDIHLVVIRDINLVIIIINILNCINFQINLGFFFVKIMKRNFLETQFT